VKYIMVEDRLSYLDVLKILKVEEFPVSVV
jgi:hypothetical protein